MATVDKYKIKIEVDGEEQVIDLEKKLDDLQGTLSKTAAAGVAAFTALAGSAVNMADSLVDLADATGISVGRLYNLSAAVEASGGKFDDGGKLLQAFSRALGQVERGSEETIESLQRLGLSRSEIESLSDEQLFNRTVEGLAKMENGFAKTDIAMKLFGKSAATIDFAKLAEGLNQAVDPELERNLKLAADAVGSMEVAFRNLQLAALSAIAPILEEIAKFEFSAENAKKAIQVLGALVAAAFGASTVIGVKKIVDLMKDFAKEVRKAGGAMAFLTGLSGVGLAAVAASAVAATAAYYALGKAMEDAGDAKEALEGAAPGVPTVDLGGGRTVGETPAEKNLKALQQSTVVMQEQNRQALEYQRIINDTIGLLDEEANRKKLNADIDKQIADQQANINKQILAQTEEQTNLRLDSARKIQNFEQQMAKQADALRQSKKLKDTAAISANLAALAMSKQQEEELLQTRLQGSQKTVAELNKQLGLVKTQGEKMRKLKLEALARTEAEARTRNELEQQANAAKQLLDQSQSNMEADQMRQLINGQINEEQMRNAIEIDRIRTESLKKIIDLEKQLAQASSQAARDNINQQIALERQRADSAIANKQREIDQKTQLENSYAAGVVKGLNQIADQFTPINMAQKAISDTWGKINSAVDEFVRTGKFKFSDFAKSVIRDLAAMIIKAQIFKAIQASLGFFGISIPGLATGGPAQAGQPYIVGEKGPELFVPKQAGTVIPNNKLGMADQAMATGRVEAPVTNNYITNNISALDAKSVAQLFAENRKSLLGATETARRELAYGT